MRNCTVVRKILEPKCGRTLDSLVPRRAKGRHPKEPPNTAAVTLCANYTLNWSMMLCAVSIGACPSPGGSFPALTSPSTGWPRCQHASIDQSLHVGDQEVNPFLRRRRGDCQVRVTCIPRVIIDGRPQGVLVSQTVSDRDQGYRENGSRTHCAIVRSTPMASVVPCGSPNRRNRN